MVVLENSWKTFAQAVAASYDIQLNQLPPDVFIGDMVSIKISQKEYEAGLKECKSNLHGRLTLQKGDPPLTTKTLKHKLDGLWQNLKNWSVIPLGKGYFEFKFNSIEDTRKIWAMRLINLKPRVLRFFCWSKDFNPQSQVQVHAQLWVRLMHLPQEYWRKTTLFEIASTIGTPLIIDEATQSRLFRHYARILVDVDMSGRLFDSVLVEREGLAFPVAIEYEKRPSFCHHYKVLGHFILQCKRLNTEKSHTVIEVQQKKTSLTEKQT